MKIDFWSQVEGAYFEALQQEPKDRAAFLNLNYPDREDIRQEVESLLACRAAGEELTPESVIAAAGDFFDDEEAPNLSGRVINDRYRILSYLSSGGFADVYLGEHVILGTPLALKRPKLKYRIDPEYRSQFKAEAQRAAVLNHENIVRIYDVVEEDDDIFAVMDHIQGETLEKRLERLQRPFSVEEFLPIATKCASALKAAHKERIIHLDVKPANIMLTNLGDVKVCDFGIARRLQSSSSTDTTQKSTERWELAGTPAYMAPEMILGKEVDERTDLFCLGIVFYQMLAARNPFNADTLDATLNRIIHETPPPIDGINRRIAPYLEEVISKLLAKDPANRFSSAEELLEKLNRITRSLNRSENLFQSIREGFRESRLAQVVAAAVVLCVLSSPAVWLYRDVWMSRLGLRYPAVRQRPVVLVGNFNNRTGNPFFDLTVPELLTISLQQSHFVSVFPRDRVRETLERMRKAPDAKLDFEISREVCVREGLSMAIMGEIGPLGEGYQVSLRIIEPQSGETQRILTAGVSQIKDLSPALDQLAAQLRSALGEGAAEIQKNLKPLMAVTTASQAALERFSQAIELQVQGRFSNSAVLLESSLELDPEFAMALGHLAIVESSDRRLALERSAKAYALRDRVTEKESDFIAATYHLFRQQHEQAANFYRAITLIDPADTGARRYLGQTYALMGKYDDAVRVYQALLQTDPRSVENRVMLAQYQSYAGQLQAGIRTLEEVRRTDPQNDHAYWAETDLWMAQGDLTQAQLAAAKLSESQSETFQDNAFLRLAQILIHEGRLVEAINQLEIDLIRFQNSSDTVEFARHYWLSELYTLTGRMAEAERHIRYLTQRPVLPPFISDLRAAGLWAIHQSKGRIVESALSSLRQIEVEYPSKLAEAAICEVEGEQAAALGNSSIAREKLEQAYLLWPDPLITRSLAEVLISVGEHDRALVLYDTLLRRKGEMLRWHPASLWLMAHFRAAQLATESRNPNHARDSYRQIIQFWGSSPDLRDFVNQARLEMQRLPVLQ